MKRVLILFTVVALVVIVIGGTWGFSTWGKDGATGQLTAGSAGVLGLLIIVIIAAVAGMRSFFEMNVTEY